MSLLDEIQDQNMRDCARTYGRGKQWSPEMRARVQAVLDRHDNEPTAIGELIPIISDWCMDTYVQ